MQADENVGSIGPKTKTFTKSGFLRTHEFNHIYKGVEKDVDRLIKEGYLVEFKDNTHLHELIKKKNATSNRREDQRISTIMYPVNMDDQAVEVRGTHGKYNQGSLTLLSKLWNQHNPLQIQTEEFDWQKIIEDNKDALLDESEVTQYEFRKDQLNSRLFERDDKGQPIKRGKGRKPR